MGARAYLESQELLPLMKALLETVVREMPDDPYAFVADQLHIASKEEKLRLEAEAGRRHEEERLRLEAEAAKGHEEERLRLEAEAARRHEEERLRLEEEKLKAEEVARLEEQRRLEAGEAGRLKAEADAKDAEE